MKMKNFALKYKLEFIGVIIGAVGGWVYWYTVGCASGTCPITSKPLNSILYGALMGGLVLSLFKKSKK